jgi:hypothetical protein
MITATRAWVAMFPIALACVTSRARDGHFRGYRSDGRVCAISLFDATFARLDPVVAG